METFKHKSFNISITKLYHLLFSHCVYRVAQVTFINYACSSKSSLIHYQSYFLSLLFAVWSRVLFTEQDQLFCVFSLFYACLWQSSFMLASFIFHLCLMLACHTIVSLYWGQVNLLASVTWDSEVRRWEMALRPGPLSVCPLSVAAQLVVLMSWMFTFMHLFVQQDKRGSFRSFFTRTLVFSYGLKWLVSGKRLFVNC